MERPPSPAKGPKPFGDEPDGEASRAELLRRHDILLLRAANPSPLTLTGTNTWVVGRRAGLGRRSRDRCSRTT